MAIGTQRPNDRPKWPRDEVLASLVARHYTVFVRNTPRPLLNYSSGHFPPGSMSRPHAHPCVALHGCLDGTLTVVAPDGEFELSAGMFSLLPPGARHHCRNDDRRTAATLDLLVDTEHPGRWPRESGVAECCRELERLATRVEKFNVTADAELAQTFWQVADRVTSDRPCNTAATVGFLWALLGQIVERLSGAAADSSAADAPRRARRFLVARLNEQISVAEVARAMQMSPTRMQELFRAAYGCGIIHYFNQLKVVQARRLLADPALTIDQVSRKLGFSSASYFGRVFLRYTGQTPGQFRASR